MLTRIALVLVTVLTAAAQSNPELARLYAEDQADRAHQFTISKEQMAAMEKNDVVRRKRVRELVDAGALSSAEDYVRAAFIFQHGEEPNDFLLAHVLGMIATKIDGSGAWISAATLDRYLLNTGKPGIFGLTLTGTAPFDKNLITDRMREAVCVPSVANRAKLMASIAKDPEHPIATDPCSPSDAAGLVKALAGKWLITAKNAKSEFMQVTLNVTADPGGGIDMDVSGPAYPGDPSHEISMGGGKLQIKIKGDVFDLAIKGDTMSGSYSSGAFSSAAIGMR